MYVCVFTCSCAPGWHMFVRVCLRVGSHSVARACVHVCMCVCVQKCLHQKASFFCAAVAAELQTEMLLVIKKNQSEKRIFGNQPAEVPFFKQAAVE